MLPASLSVVDGSATVAPAFKLQSSRVKFHRECEESFAAPEVALINEHFDDLFSEYCGIQDPTTARLQYYAYYLYNSTRRGLSIKIVGEQVTCFIARYVTISLRDTADCHVIVNDHLTLDPRSAEAIQKRNAEIGWDPDYREPERNKKTEFCVDKVRRELIIGKEFVMIRIQPVQAISPTSDSCHAEIKLLEGANIFLRSPDRHCLRVPTSIGCPGNFMARRMIPPPAGRLHWMMGDKLEYEYGTYNDCKVYYLLRRGGNNRVDWPMEYDRLHTGIFPSRSSSLPRSPSPSPLASMPSSPMGGGDISLSSSCPILPPPSSSSRWVSSPLPSPTYLPQLPPLKDEDEGGSNRGFFLSDGASEIINERRLLRRAPHNSFLNYHEKEIGRLWFNSVYLTSDDGDPLFSVSVCFGGDREQYGWLLPDDSRRFVLVYFRRRVYHLWHLSRTDIPYPSPIPPRPGHGLPSDWGVGLVRWDDRAQHKKLEEIQKEASPFNALSWVKSQLLPGCEADWSRSVILPRRHLRPEKIKVVVFDGIDSSSPDSPSDSGDNRGDTRDAAAEEDRMDLESEM